MKIIRYLIAFAAAVVLQGHALASDLGVSRVTLVEGEARLYTGDAVDWSDLAANMPLREGDRLRALQGGRVEIYLRGGTRLRLDGGTTISVERLEQGDMLFYLERGRLFVNSRGRPPGYLTVETPLSYARDSEGSVFMANVSVGGITDISVLEGSVHAEGGGVELTVRAGEAFRVRDERRAETAALGARDEWEEWNLQRDRALARHYESERYLPEELADYAPEFEAHGRWVYVSDYGRVWRPNVSITVGWAPYRHGRWLWIGSDYVWISDEPWGWAPYHYGRWVHLPRAGWCWVPPRHRHVNWGPGFVAWVGTGTYIGWAPLAPGEPYVGYGYYGPGSVNIIDIDIHKTVVYKNVRVRNAVTVIHRDHFKAGRRAHLRARHNPFLDKKARFGPPPVPERKHAISDRHKGRRHDSVVKGPVKGRDRHEGRDLRRDGPPFRSHKPGRDDASDVKRKTVWPDRGKSRGLVARPDAKTKLKRQKDRARLSPTPVPEKERRAYRGKVETRRTGEVRGPVRRATEGRNHVRSEARRGVKPWDTRKAREVQRTERKTDYLRTKILKGKPASPDLRRTERKSVSRQDRSRLKISRVKPGTARDTRQAQRAYRKSPERRDHVAAKSEYRVKARAGKDRRDGGYDRERRSEVNKSLGQRQSRRLPFGQVRAKGKTGAHGLMR